MIEFKNGRAINLKITFQKETEKAVGLETQGKFNCHLEDYEKIIMWLPKSQLKIEDGIIVDMVEWLFKKNFGVIKK